MKKRILITGGAGFLGSHLCDRFINEALRQAQGDNSADVMVSLSNHDCIN